MRRARRLVVGLALVGALGTGGGVAWLFSPWGEAWVAGLAQRQLQGLLAPGWTVGRPGVELGLDGTIVLTDVLLTDPDGRPAISVGRLDAGLLLPEPPWRAVHLGTLSLSDVTVRLASDADGVLDLVRAFGGPFPPDPDAAPWGGLPVGVVGHAVRLRKVEVSIEAPDEAGQRTTTLRVVVDALSGRVALPKGRSEVDVAGLESHGVVWTPGPAGFRVAGDVRWKGDGLDLGGLLAQVGGSVVTVDGSLTGLGSDDPRVDARLRVAPLDLRTVQELTGAAIEGRFRGELTADGPLGGLALTGTIVGTDGTPGALVLQPGSTVCVPDGVVREVDPCGPQGAPRPVAADAPLRWAVDALLSDLAVERIAPVVGGPLVLQGRITGRGGGTAWPDGVVVEEARWSGEHLDVYGVPVRRFDLGATLSQGVLGFHDADLEGVAGTVLGGGTLDLVGGGLDLALHGALRPAMLEDFGVDGLGGHGSYRGRVSGDIHADGVPIDVVADLRLAPLTWGGDDVVLAKVGGPLRVKVRGGNVDVAADLFAEGIDAYGAHLPALGVPDFAVRVADGSVVVTGTVLAPEATYGEHVRVEKPSGTVAIRVPSGGEVEVDVDLDVGAQDLFGLLGTQGAGTVRLRGDDLRLGLDLRWEDEPFVRLDGFAYDLGTRSLGLEAFDLWPTARQHWALAAPARLRLTDGGVADASVELRSSFGTLAVEGTLGSTGPLDGRIRASGLDLEAFAEMFPDQLEGLDGTLDLTLVATGTGRRPTVSVELAAERLFWEGRFRYLDARGTALLADDRLTLDLGTRVGGRPWLEVQGFLPVRADLSDLGVRTAGETGLTVVLAPGGLERFVHALPGITTPEGQASAVVALTGPLRDPRLDLDGVAELDFPDLTAPLRVQADVVREAGSLLAHVDLFDGYRPMVALDGRAATRIGSIVDWLLGEGPEPDLTDPSLYADQLDAVARLTHADVLTLRRLLGADVDLTGKVDGSVRVTGSPRRPTLAADLSTDAVAGGETLPVTLDVAPGEAGYAVDLVVGDPAAPWTRVQGTVPLDVDTTTDWSTWSTAPMALSATGSGLPVSVLRALDPALEVESGRIVFDGRIEGTVVDVAPDLTLHLEDVVARYRPLGLAIRGAAGEARLTHPGPGRMRVELVQARAETRPLTGSLEQVAQGGPSRVELAGSVDLDGSTPTAVSGKAVLQGAWLSATPERVLRASGTIEASGSWPEVRAGGRVEVDQGRFLLNTGDLLQDRSATLSPVVVVHREGRAGVRGAVAPAPSWLRGLVVDVGVGLGRNTELQLKVPVFEDLGAVGAQMTRATIDARLGGDVAVGLRDGDLSLVGDVETLDGRVRILQGDFTLGAGSRVSFLGKDYANPALDISGTMGVTGGEVRLGLSGTALDPSFSFSSDDFGSDVAILTILLTGEAPDELSANQGEAALQAVGKLLVGGLFGSVSFGSFGVEPDGTIRFGLPLYRTLYLETIYRPTAGLAENTITVGGEWSILPRFVLDASYGDRRVEGRLAWELRFTGACDRARDALTPSLGVLNAERTPCHDARRATRALSDGVKSEGD